jgi:hypothetical protein
LLNDSATPFGFPFAAAGISPLETNEYGVNTPFLLKVARLNIYFNERVFPLLAAMK